MLTQALTATAACAAIIGLILLAGRAARRFTLPRVEGDTAKLAHRGCLALDRTRRLHLVDACGQTALILTGGTADAMLVLPRPEP